MIGSTPNYEVKRISFNIRNNFQMKLNDSTQTKIDLDFENFVEKRQSECQNSNLECVQTHSNFQIIEIGLYVSHKIFKI